MSPFRCDHRERLRAARGRIHWGICQPEATTINSFPSPIVSRLSAS